MTNQPKSCLIWVWQLSSIHISQSALHNSKQPPKLLSTSLGNISKAEFKVLLSWRRGHVGKQRQSFSCPVRKPATGWQICGQCPVSRAYLVNKWRMKTSVSHNFLISGAVKFKWLPEVLLIRAGDFRSLPEVLFHILRKDIKTLCLESS